MSGPKVNETPEEAMSSHFEYKNKDQHTHTYLDHFHPILEHPCQDPTKANHRAVLS